jgi:hypothetical protein
MLGERAACMCGVQQVFRKTSCLHKWVRVLKAPLVPMPIFQELDSEIQKL